jgi:Reverse transcriptase (RNA-dependent DNA polymerase)/RNase H-like domain found in reverse transcriptase
MDIMTEVSLSVDTAEKCITWDHGSTPLKRRGVVQNHYLRHHTYALSVAAPIIQEAEERQSRILDADYSKVDIAQHVSVLDHLNSEEKRVLTEMLNQFPVLFGGGLGTLLVRPVHLELRADARPYHSRPFPVPQSLYSTTKKEIDRLIKIGVIQLDHNSEWVAPTFIQPKKTGDVQILTDCRKLNEAIVHKLLPKISELFQKVQGFTFATAIDLSMGYYHIPLDDASQKLCTMILPWGKYRYLLLPMGIKNSPDIFQSIMDDILGDLEYSCAYKDDILITSSGNFNDHLDKVRTVLKRFELIGFCATVRKCFFVESKLDYLGYLISRNGIQSQPKKMEAILRLKEPKNKRQLRHFLGMVNYYRDMWRQRSHRLVPLTQLVSNSEMFQWTTVHQEAYNEVKWVISKETLLSFPDFDKPFHVYTDASKYQLGSIIMQDDKPLAFYSRKLNPA